MKKLSNMSNRSLVSDVVRGQYVGYTEEPGVSPQSRTETYFRIKTHINSSKWRGVPFYLESGKAMSESKAEIDVYFKNEIGEEGQNILTFGIQPDEGIRIKFFVKRPGYGVNIEPKTLKFRYADVASFPSLPNDYERLIYDAFMGDQTLFASTDEIMASWKFVTSIIDNWENLPLIKYEKGVKEIE